MAKKGQKQIRYTDSEKEKIVGLYKSGVSGYYLAREYELPVGTIKTWKYKLDHPEKITGNKRGQYKRPVSMEDYKERYEILKKYRAFLRAQRERK